MSRVLYVMYGMPSCYNSGFAFARKFASAGIEFRIACDQDISDQARNAEIPFYHLQSISAEANLRRWLEIKSCLNNMAGGEIFRVVRLIKAKLALRNKTIADNEIQQLITTYKPDLLLIDIECHVAIIASANLGFPTALCSRLFDHRPGGNLPPLHSNIIPSQALDTKVRVAAQWRWLRVSALFKSVRQKFSIGRLSPITYRTTKMPDIKALARQKQVDLKSISTTAFWFQPVAYHHVPVLSMTLKELDFERAKQEGFTYLGPMIDDSDFAFDFKSAQVDVIDHFIATARSSGKKVIYCAMGTFAQREPRFVKAMRDLAESRDDLALVISLGGREKSDDYLSFPPNCLLLDTAPQLKCLTEADAAILHSGIASLQEALKHCVPLLIFAVDSMDQNGCAVRWTELGLARRFYLNSVTASSLAADLDGILADQKMTDRLKKYSRLIEKSSSNFSPVKLIEHLTTNSVSENFLTY